MTRTMHRAPAWLAAMLLAAALSQSPAPAAVPAPWPEDLPAPGSEEYAAARAEFVGRLTGLNDKMSRLVRLGEIALIERPGGLMEEFAARMLDQELGGSSLALYRVYYSGDAITKQRVLRMWRDKWAILGQGTSAWLTEMVRSGLHHDDPDVRREAALLAAEFPIQYIGHAAIDAAITDPRLTRAALSAIRTTRDFRTTRWVLAQVGAQDPLTRDAALLAIRGIGRAGARYIVPETAADDPVRRANAIHALLTIATAEERSLLFRWIGDDGDSNPELAAVVTRAIASIEAGGYQPVLPEPPPLGLD